MAASVASFDTFHALSAQHQLSRFAESCVAKSNVRVRDGMKDTFGCWLMVASEVLDLFYVGLPKNRGYSNLWQFSKYADQPRFFVHSGVLHFLVGQTHGMGGLSRQRGFVWKPNPET